MAIIIAAANQSRKYQLQNESIDAHLSLTEQDEEKHSSHKFLISNEKQDLKAVSLGKETEGGVKSLGFESFDYETYDYWYPKR